jgi:hypothetical protein
MRVYLQPACPQVSALLPRAARLDGRAVVLPVDITQGEINKELGLPSDYTKYGALLGAEKALLSIIDLPYLLR